MPGKEVSRETKRCTDTRMRTHGTFYKNENDQSHKQERIIPERTRQKKKQILTNEIDFKDVSFLYSLVDCSLRCRVVPQAISQAKSRA